MKQINIKFSEQNAVDMKVYERIKAEPKITEYIRQLVLQDIMEDNIRKMYYGGLLKDGTKD